MFSIYPRFVEIETSRVTASWCQDIYCIEKTLPIFDQKIIILPKGPHPLWLLPLVVEWVPVNVSQFKKLEITLKTFESQFLEIAFVASDRVQQHQLCLMLEPNKTTYEIELNIIPIKIAKDLLQVSFAHKQKLEITRMILS